MRSGRFSSPAQARPQHIPTPDQVGGVGRGQNWAGEPLQLLTSPKDKRELLWRSLMKPVGESSGRSQGILTHVGEASSAIPCLDIDSETHTFDKIVGVLHLKPK